MRTEADSFDILDRALKAANADEADAVFISSDSNNSRFANSQIHQNMSEVSAELTLRVFVAGAMGVASTTSFDRAEIEEMANTAREAARHSLPLPKFNGLYKVCGPASAGRLKPARTPPPAEKARALKEVFARDAKFAGSYGTSISSVACGNTHGIRRYCTTSVAEATVIAIRGEQSGYATAIARDAIDVIALGDEALERATLNENARAKIEPGAYDVILEPAAIAEVLEWMEMITFSGQSFEDGSSFFVDNLGKPMLSKSLTIADDAIDPDFLPFPFDLEGLPKRRIVLIDKGAPKTPVVDKIYADRLGIEPTANCWALGSPDHGMALHPAIEPGDATREEMIRSTQRGIWVTRFNYVNGLLEPKTALMTGTTRDGTFLIRDGEVAARLPNLRWTQSIVEAFSRIVALTRDRRRVGAWFNAFGGALSPAIKIEGWHFD
ncbi:MAG TPA: TldD/PmbA family protein [Thermoanaerobaculia bacterium]|nr:TldD/PmbA family protein [Thermoanaerobaculia bacterium]